MAAEGGTLRRGLSVTMKKNIIACQPFKDGVSTIICSGCHALMAYPAGSKKVKCSACDTLTTGIKVPCTSCKIPLRLPISLEEAVCSNCGYHFQPVSTFKLQLPPGKEIKMVDAAQVHDDKQKEETLKLQLVPAPGLDCEFTAVNVTCLLGRPLSSNFIGWCSKLGLTKNMSFICHNVLGDSLDVTQTPKILGLQNEEVINLTKEFEETSSGSHHFKSHQYKKPTNCAYCHKFIWGLYKQGQWCTKCHIPVHHRCSKKVSCVCEMAIREACGLTIDEFGNDEDIADSDIPQGFPINEEDMADWEECTRATTTYKHDSFMSSFGKLSDWTDEEIAEVWKKYDDDQNGHLDKEELTQFIGDLLGAQGGSFSEQAMQDEVDRVLSRMDTNGNGIIEWEEFWYFHQAQRASDFLESFQGLQITEDEALEIWEQYDADGSGSLDSEEVGALLRDCAKAAGGSIEKITREAAAFWELGELVTWEKFKEVFLPVISQSVDLDM
eukprot:TRINITY_DN412_c1_g1_i1.p1 TRINITY_DN412_c1_g1~~TRINITY_DN412_c1_g1_i1.p1  ORF type:complete len:496 (+),score=87.14 TRINITY_DN412_c1_g1_i1:48-1535(+)